MTRPGWPSRARNKRTRRSGLGFRFPDMSRLLLVGEERQARRSAGSARKLEGQMRTNARRTAIIAAVILSISVVAAGVLAATQSSDEQALAPTRPAASRSIERKVDDLLAKMTTQEKLQQVQLLADWQANDDEAKAGVGGMFSLTDPDRINHLQHVAVEQSRLHIPILFAFDTIHGYRTIFPIPLG